jgi:hypothetical protein
LLKVNIFDSLVATGDSRRILHRLLQDALEQQSLPATQLMEICLRDSELRKSFLNEFLLIDGSSSLALIERYSSTIYKDMSLNFDKYCLVFNSPDNIQRPVVLNLVVGLLDQLCQNRVSLKRECVILSDKVCRYLTI